MANQSVTTVLLILGLASNWSCTRDEPAAAAQATPTASSASQRATPQVASKDHAAWRDLTLREAVRGTYQVSATLESEAERTMVGSLQLETPEGAATPAKGKWIQYKFRFASDAEGVLPTALRVFQESPTGFLNVRPPPGRDEQDTLKALESENFIAELDFYPGSARLPKDRLWSVFLLQLDAQAAKLRLHASQGQLQTWSIEQSLKEKRPEMSENARGAESRNTGPQSRATTDRKPIRLASKHPVAERAEHFLNSSDIRWDPMLVERDSWKLGESTRGVFDFKGQKGAFLTLVFFDNVHDAVEFAEANFGEPEPMDLWGVNGPLLFHVTGKDKWLVGEVAGHFAGQE